ncbi:MAG: SprT protein [Candidatus Endobugula sp.]|jgi:SprT protein
MPTTSIDAISPIDLAMQRRVSAEVKRYLPVAESLYQRPFADIEVLFDLKGRAAGMYRVKAPKVLTTALTKRLTRLPSLDFGVSAQVQRSIRFNPWLFAKYPEDSWQNTIPHEVAHYIADCLYGIKAIRPHGKEWQQIMRDLGAEPIVRAAYDLSGIPVRQVRRYLYRCQCRDVPLTSYRHQKIQRGLQRYRCRDCGKQLRYSQA